MFLNLSKIYLTSSSSKLAVPFTSASTFAANFPPLFTSTTIFARPVLLRPFFRLDAVLRLFIFRPEPVLLPREERLDRVDRTERAERDDFVDLEVAVEMTDVRRFACFVYIGRADMGGIGGRGGISVSPTTFDVVCVCVTPTTLFPFALEAFFFPFGLPLMDDGIVRCERGGGGMLRKGTFDVRSL